MRKKPSLPELFYSLIMAAFSVFAAYVVLLGSQRLLRVAYEAIDVTGLPAELEGLRILHVTDLHSRSADRIDINIWRKMDELDFDLVAFTGDIVDANAYQLEPHLPYIKKLAEKHPVFFAEGNHDHFSMKRLRTYLEDAGVTVLIDEKVPFTLNGREFEVIGLNDWYTADLDVSRSLFTKSDKLRLTLAHQPQHTDYVDTGASPCVVLSGHTHGGQCRAPFMPTIYAPGQGFFPKYGYGKYNVNGASLYVSRGIGSTGNVPFRIWNRPEICVLTLTSGEKEQL